MNKRFSKFLAVMLIIAMSLSAVSCSAVEEFFTMDHDGSRRHHSRDKDDDDDRKKPGSGTSETEEEEDFDEPSDSDEFVFDDSITYPDHVPTLEELHPYHAPGNISGQAASDLLDEIEHEYIQMVISGSYVNACILFEDVESMGYEISDVSWGSIMDETEESSDYTESVLEQLYSIDYESLDFQDRAFYDKIVYDFEINKYMESYTAFSYYSVILDPLLGPQTELLFILDILDFNTVQDAENYLILLNDIDRFYDELALFEEERFDLGFQSTSAVYEDIAASFDGLAVQVDDCFLYESFEARLDNIPGLKDEDREDLIRRHNEVMHNVVFPEFEEVADRMRVLASESTAVQHGICDYPGGQAYYSVLFMDYANSNKSIEQSVAEVEAMVQSRYSTMMSIAYSGDSSWRSEYSFHNYSYGSTTANLDYLETVIPADFPTLPTHAYVLRDVPESLQENFSPAAYLGYHLDNFNSNMIITNQASVTDTFGVTCAHEGYPGHMFQSVYTRSICEHPYLYLNDSVGYTEGWATYVENYSFRYFVENENAGILIQIENEFNILLFARFDIGINYEGWDIDDCNAYYSSVFGTDMNSEGIEQIYAIVTNQPGYGVKYGLGYINTGIVMTQAHRDFPDATDLEIHTAYLNALPLTFEMIYERMTAELSGN